MPNGNIEVIVHKTATGKEILCYIDQELAKKLEEKLKIEQLDVNLTFLTAMGYKNYARAITQLLPLYIIARKKGYCGLDEKGYDIIFDCLQGKGIVRSSYGFDSLDDLLPKNDFPNLVIKAFYKATKIYLPSEWLVRANQLAFENKSPALVIPEYMATIRQRPKTATVNLEKF